MISIIKQPPIFSPASNPVVYSITGSSTGLTFFKVELKEAITNTSVFTANFFPTPNNPTKASFNLSNQLSSLVKSDIENANSIAIPKPVNYLSYYITATEYGVNTGGTITGLSSTITADTRVAIESELNIQNFNDYYVNDYLVATGNTNVKFLTYSPNNKGVNSLSNEQLYFLQSGYTGLNIEVKVNNLTKYNFNITGNTNTTNEVKAIAYLSGFTQPTGSTNSRIQIIEPVGGSYYIYSGLTTGVSLSDYITNLCNNINTSPTNNGYIASVVNSTTFSIQAKAGLGALINTYPAYFSYSDGTNAATGIFSDGVSSSTTVSDLYKMYRIQTSPKKLVSSGVTLSVGDSYTVCIKSSSATTASTLTEIRTYKVEDVECNIDYVNVLFSNSLGGVDTIQLINPQETFSTTKESIKKTNINLDNDNVFVTNNKFNVSDVVYNSNTKYTFKAYTQPLSDEQAVWISELINSKEHYIELSDGLLMPVKLLTSNYNIQKVKYLTELNQYQFEFEIGNGYNPAITNGNIIIN